MSVLLNMIEEHYRANAHVIKKQIELRYGQLVNANNQLQVQVFSVHEEDYALIKISGQDVIFVTVDWQDPSVKFTYL